MALPASTCGARLLCLDPVAGRSRRSVNHGELEYRAVVAPEVTVTWDPADPRRCVDFVGPQGMHLADVDRGPWLRLAGVIVLDQRLYLPLNRSLLDAEVAVAQLAAATTQTVADPIREFLTRKALFGARRASRGVVAYLRRFVADDRRPPPALAASVGMMARGYASLSEEVQGFDAELTAVTAAWRRVAAIERATERVPTIVAPAAPPPRRPGVAQIDPRWVPARVLRLGPTEATAEIRVEPVVTRGGTALRISVDAFDDQPRHDLTDLEVRVIGHRSGQLRGSGLLGWQTDEHQFACTVTLPDSVSVPDVQIDVFGAAGPGNAATDHGELRRARRATLFLADWRALVADVRLWGMRAAPTTRMRAIVRRMSDEQSGIDRPLWSGGPSRSNLECLAELGDRALTAMLRKAATSGRVTAIPGDDGGAAAVAASVSGPGSLVAAELAAAFERSRRRTPR